MEGMRMIDLNGFPSEQLKQEIQAELSSVGLVLIKGVSSDSVFLEVGSSIGIVANYGDMGPILTISNKGDPLHLNSAFTREPLALHTDRSVLAVPPKYLLTYIRSPSERGGESIFVDGHKLKEILKENDPELYELMRRPNAILLKSHDGGFAFHSIFDRLPNGNDFMRFRFEENLSGMGPKMASRFPELLKLMETLLVQVKLGEGEGYILDNHRWLHGRNSYFGYRDLAAMHSNPEGFIAHEIINDTR